MRFSFLMFAVLSTSVAQMSAQSTNPLSKEIKQAYEMVKGNLLKTADLVPQEDYSFKPTPETRSFSEVFEHVVNAQMRSCGAVNGATPAKPPAMENRTALVDALKQSFAECDKAYDSLTDANATEMITAGPRQRTRLGMLAGNTTHDTEQYAILGVYMRLKGLVPPSSEGPAKR